MNKILKRSLIFVMIALCFVAVFGFTSKMNVKAAATSYTLVFAKNAGDGTSLSTSDTAASILSSGASYVTGNLTTATNAYKNGSDGLKLGTSKNNGIISFSLSSEGSVTPTSVVVSAKRYNSDKAVKISVNGEAAQDLTASFANYTFNITSSISSITITSTKGTSGGPYCWIESITVNYDDAPVQQGEVNVTGVSLDRNVASIYVGQNVTLIPNVSPANATDKGVSWNSDKTSVATVSNGTVTGVSAGQATITVTTDDGSFTDTCVVTVNNPIQYDECEFGVGDFLITTVSTKNQVETKAYLPTTRSTGASPTAEVFTNIGYVSTDNLWHVTMNGENYVIQNSSGDYLYISGSGNSNVRVGPTQDTWVYDSVNKTLQDVNNSRFLGVYNENVDWRSYTSNDASNYYGSAKALKFYKVHNDQPLVDFSNYIEKTMVGAADYQFGYYSENINDLSGITWSSSNQSVATINSSGLFHIVGAGETTIKVSITINEVEYKATKVVKVWPSNTSDIDVATALKICEMADGDNAPYSYSLFGTVKSVTDVDNFVITDGTNDINVYKTSHTAEVSNRYYFTFYQTKVENSTYSIKYLDIKNVYVVTFDSDGGSAVSPINDVVAGSKIVAPTDPTKQDYTFAGWYSGQNEWNFATATVSTNLTLKARWNSNDVFTMQNNLNNILAYMSMAYQYSFGTASNVSDTLNETLLSQPASYGAWQGKTHNSTAIYAGYSMKGNKNTIQMNSSNNSGIVSVVSGGLIKTVTVAWNSSTNDDKAINVYGSNTPYTSSADLKDAQKQGTLIGTIVKGTTTYLNIVADYKYIGIRPSDGAMYLDSVQFDWYGGDYENVDFCIKCGVDKSLSGIISELDGAVYGIEVSDGSKTQKYASDSQLMHVEQANDGKMYVIIDLGDALNNIARLGKEFTVRAYVEYDGNYYYSTTTKVASIASLTVTYDKLNNQEIDEKIAGLKNILVALGYDFN